MSYERMVASLRDDLVRGGARRRRFERRRKVLLLSAPVLALALLAGSFVFVHESDTSTNVVTQPGATPADLAACEAFLEFWDATQLPNNDAWEPMREQAKAALSAADAEVLRTWGQSWTSPPEQTTQAQMDAYRDATTAAVQFCRDAGAPGWAIRYVPAALGPEPRVDLEAFGQVDALRPFAPGDAVPDHLKSTLVGRDIGDVELAQTTSGAWIAHYSVGGGDARHTCYTMGTPQQSGGVCVPESSGWPGPGSFSGPLSGSGGPGTVAFVVDSPDTSFVVVESGDRRFVQRPALGMIAMAPDPPISDGGHTTVREYDKDGNQLTCRNWGSNEPALVSDC